MHVGARGCGEQLLALHTPHPGGASRGRPDDAWTSAPEKKTRKLADGRFALSRSNSSHMWASSWSQVTDTSTPSSSRCGTWPRTPYSRRQTLPASPPAPGTRPREGRRLPDRVVRTAGQEAATVAAHHPHARGGARGGARLALCAGRRRATHSDWRIRTPTTDGEGQHAAQTGGTYE